MISRIRLASDDPETMARPYSLFMMSPERVLGLKRAAEVRASRRFIAR